MSVTKYTPQTIVPLLFAMFVILVIYNYHPKAGMWLLFLIFLVLMINVQDDIIWALKGVWNS